MQYGLSDEQEMIVETVRRFVETEIYPHEDLVERTGEVPEEIAAEIKRKTLELGFYACNFPESVSVKLGNGAANCKGGDAQSREAGLHWRSGRGAT